MGSYFRGFSGFPDSRHRHTVNSERGSTSLLPGAFRRKTNLLLGVASELAAPLLRPVAAVMSRGKYSSPSAWRRGLIIGHNHIGDVLYRTPSLPALHQSLPDCEWSYLASPSSAPMLEGNPNLNEVLPWSRGLDSWDLGQHHRDELSRRKFDVVLCSNTLRHYPDFLLATRLGIPNRVGFVHKGLSGLINHPVPMVFPSPYAGYFRSMVAATIGRFPDWSLTPQIFLDESDRAEAQGTLLKAGVAADDLPLLACSLTTRQHHGNWPVESMLSVIREARNNTEFRLLLCGAPGDSTQLRTIAERLEGDVRVLAGRVSIRGYAALLERCAAQFCLDSGPRHIANAVGTRVVFARNMSHSRVEAGTYCDTETDITPGGEYQTDAEIQAAAARMSTTKAARVLSDAIQSGALRA